MKILAIRGENLASLGRSFALRLNDPPLSQHGLYAITGPTGAGKSTLLDALCLALFDAIPRLGSGKGTLVGRRGEGEENWTNSTDVRSILRRGAAHGWAEVDFIGVDGQVYRAKWEVRRAYKRANGRLQPQTIELWNVVSNQPHSGGKDEIKQAIRDKLGLDFDQFRRSVFLSQGEFSAFLKSDAKQRGDLLEQITGATLYGRISQLAYERANKEKIIFQEIEAKLGETLPLTPAARQQLQESRDEVAQQIALVVEKQQKIQQWQVWQQQTEQLTRQLTQAQEQRQLADASWLAAEPRRVYLQTLQEVQPLRQVVAAWDQAQRQLQETEKLLAAEQVRQTGLEGQLNQSRQEQERQRDLLSQQENHWQEVQRLLGVAQGLDARRQEAAKALDAAQTRQKGENDQKTATESALQEASRQLSQLEEAMAQADTWFQNHAIMQPMVEQWPRWSGEFSRHEQLQKKLTQQQKVLAGLQEKLQEGMANRQSVASQVQESEVNLLRMDGEINELHASWSQLNPGLLAEQREELVGAQRLLEQEKELLRLGEIVRQWEKEGEESQQKQSVAQKEWQGCQLQLEQLRHTLQRSRNAVEGDVVILRQGLQESQPCPVCGSLDHPWAESTPRLQEELRSWQEQFDKVQEKIDHWRGEAVGWESRLNHAREQQAATATLLENLQHLRGDGQGEEKTLSALQAAMEEGIKQQAAIVALEKQAGQLLIRQQEKQRQRQTLATTLEKQRTALITQEQHLSRMEQQIAVGENSLETLQRGSEEVLTVLVEPLGHIPQWQDRFKRDHQRWHRQLDTLAKEWQKLSTTRQHHGQEALQRRQEIIHLQEEVQRSLQRLTEIGQEVASRQTYLDEVVRQRQGVLAGRDWRQVEKEEKSALERVVKASEATDKKISQLDKDQNQCLLTISRLSATVEQQQNQVVVQGEKLTLALADKRTLEELRRLLAVDEGFLQQEQKELANLDQARQRASTLVEERLNRQQDHLLQRPAQEFGENIPQLLEELAQQSKTLHDQGVQIAIQLQNDDLCLQKSANLMKEKEQQRQVCEIWEGMRELIGSARGDKFRTYAQGLTLNMLLEQANRHLAELTRRYQLERTPASDLEIQVVDREMGDEVRSVASLSGGETFLVSLALALSLSSLAAHRVRVESLFIDEGFGTLDADTLEMVLASLDSLQSLGRQVGIISHVATLVERIGIQIKVVPMGGGRSKVEIPVMDGCSVGG